MGEDFVHPPHFPPVLDSISSPLRTGAPLFAKCFEVAHKTKHSHKVGGRNHFQTTPSGPATAR